MPDKLYGFFSQRMVTVILMGLLCHIVSCDRDVEPYEVFTETAKVTEKSHTAAWMIPVSIGKTIIIRHHPATYVTCFKGEIDFCDKTKNIYDKFREDDDVIITYRVIYTVKHGEIVSERYEFIDVKLKQE